MEAWGFEFPFNNRALFVAEWEELWLRYLVARYDAYRCIYFWTLQNEYEYYPDGDWRYNPLADRWAMRVGRWVKGVATHRHVVAVHNGPRQPPFAERFAADPRAIDAIMFQAWGATDEENGWLAMGIEDEIQTALKDWPGSAVFAEYGYERNPDLPLVFPGFRYTDASHNRRGAWRGAFSGLGVINGFENSWGPAMILDRDQEGVAYLQHVGRFFREVVPFGLMRPAPELLVPGEWEPGRNPLALATKERDVVAVYLPAGGEVVLTLADDRAYAFRWYEPRTGELFTAGEEIEGERNGFVAPPGYDDQWQIMRIPVHMAATINRLNGCQRRLLQELGREPTPAEIAAAMGMLRPDDLRAIEVHDKEGVPLDPAVRMRRRQAANKVRHILRISQERISLDRPVGNEENGSLGDSIEDDTVPGPVKVAPGGQYGFAAPPGFDVQGRPWDWVLVLREREDG
jgi:hypothetical protein